MIHKREKAQTIEERDTTEAEYARLFASVLRGMVLIIALCSFIAFLTGLLSGAYGAGWGAAVLVFMLSSFILMRLIPKPETLPAIERERVWKSRQPRLPWSLFAYCLITGLGWNWGCAYLWFSRRYDLFSTRVIGATGLIMASYAAIALLAAWLTGRNWRIALLFFALLPGVLASIVLRLGLLR